MTQMTANREMVGMRRELLSSSPLLSSGTDPTNERDDKNSLSRLKNLFRNWKNLIKI
jgi:hypothetical protein